MVLSSQYRTVHADSALWTIITLKMRKWFPNSFVNWKVYKWSHGHIMVLSSQYRTVHADSALWTIITLKMRKWFPNSFANWKVYKWFPNSFVNWKVYKWSHGRIMGLNTGQSMLIPHFEPLSHKRCRNGSQTHFLIEMCTNGKRCLFHSLIPLNNLQIFKHIVKCETFFSLKDR